MFLNGKIRVVWAWAVLFAVLFNVALQVSAAMRAEGQPVLFAEICTTDGSRLVALHDGTSDEAGKGLSPLHDGHCNLCVIHLAACLRHGETAALPVQARQAYVLHASSQVIPSQHFSFRTPPSQAPPSFS